MINRHGAFLVGYTVPIVGIHFNATQVLAEAGRGATGELSVRVTRQIEAWGSRRGGVVENVRRVAALLGEAGLDGGPLPKHPDDYYAWAERIEKGFHERYAKQAETVGIDSARLVGHALGNALLTLNVALLVEHLRGASPEHAWLNQQALALGNDQAKAVRVIANVADHAMLTDGARDIVREIAAAVSACPIAGSANPDGMIGPIQAAMRALSEKVPLVEQTFPTDGPAT